MTEDNRQVALITGSGRGIGRAIAMALSKKGYFVCINYKTNEKAAGQTLASIEKAGGRGACFKFDVTDHAMTEAAVKKIISLHQKIDILVNNAGIRDDRLMAMMKPESWSMVMNTTLHGFFNVTRPIVKSMIKHQYGRIVNMASAAGQTGNAGQVNYSAAKAGLIGATRALSREIARKNITVNAVSPGFIETEMLNGMDMSDIIKTIPANRLGSPEEVAHLVVFLCSKEAAYITGQVIGVNGGII